MLPLRNSPNPATIFFKNAPKSQKKFAAPKNFIPVRVSMSRYYFISLDINLAAHTGFFRKRSPPYNIRGIFYSDLFSK
jgi:hypothetical protein